MNLLLMMVFIIVQPILALRPSSSLHNQMIKTENSNVTSADAKKEALKDTAQALEQFETFVKGIFGKGSSDSFSKFLLQDEETKHVPPLRAVTSEEMNWSGLDDLPECSNQTKANNTMCIEKSASPTKNTTKEVNEEEPYLTFKKRQPRETRELEVESRKRRYSGFYKSFVIDKQPQKVRDKLMKIPKSRHSEIEKIHPMKRAKFFKNLANNKPTFLDKPKKKKKEEKIDFDLMFVDMSSLGTAFGKGGKEKGNRLHGFPDQIREQKKRMLKYKRIYSQFDEYHLCNKRKLKWYKKPWKDLKLYFRVSGQHVHLPCNVCVRPDENVEDYDLRWKRRPTEKTEMEKMNVLGYKDQDDESSRFSWRPGGILNIDDLQVDDTGQYICLQDNEYEAVHILEVTGKEPTKMVFGKMLKKEGKGELPKKSVNLQKHNLRVFTKWDPWTPCSKCDARGKKRRFGICFVRKIKPLQPVRPQDAKVFDYFPEGLACRSSLLPEYIQKFKEIGKRKSEVQTKYCYVRCNAPPRKRVIRGRDGKRVEVIKSSRGYKHFRNKLDKFPKLVRRNTTYVVEGGKVEITCVKKIKAMAIIRWQKGFKILDPVELPRITKLRMRITSTNKLQISDVMKSDKGLYSCWTDGTLRKTTKLKVFAAKATGIKDKLVYVGVGLSGLVIILLLSNVGKNKKNIRKHAKQDPTSVKT